VARRAPAASGSERRLLVAEGSHRGRVPSVKPHDLRHYYPRVDHSRVRCGDRAALGHASATVTLNTYAHLWPTAEDRTRAAAASMLAETLGDAD
jgi:integrase